MKHENKWFKYCWGASIVQNVLQIFNIGISSTIYRGAFSESLYGLLFIIVNSLTWILMLFFFAQGLKALQKNGGRKGTQRLCCRNNNLVPRGLLSEHY